MVMTDFKYVGSELELFAAVHNWKRYWASQIQRYISGDVLEVGAGIGSNTRFMDLRPRGRWVCLEPDAGLTEQLVKNLKESENTREREVVCGTIQSLGENARFDTIIYIDVLEHIERDAGELANAAAMVRPGGRIIVLSPAHQKLYTPFDKEIGHFRRYSRPMLRKVGPPGLRLEKLFYLDSAGLLLSSANLLLLRQSMPTKRQLAVWDTYVIPVSRLLDPLLGRSVGKSIVGVWQRT
jgi:SAM-dependent methyltransferase